MKAVFLDKYAADLKPYKAGKSNFHMPYDKPVPKALITKLVKARVEENEAAQKANASAKAKPASSAKRLPVL